METIISFFNHPFFSIVGGVTTIVALLYSVYSFGFILKKGYFVWRRLGLGLWKRKIAIFAKDQYDLLYNLIVNSGLFEKKNIKKVLLDDLENKEDCSLWLIHYDYCKEVLEKILLSLGDSNVLIVYAPKSEGEITEAHLAELNKKRNCIVVNFRGRLLNDLLVSMVTSGNKK